MAVILLNCVTLALYQPCDGVCDTSSCHILSIIDHVIFAFFTVEMLIKMIAMGIYGKKTYLADSWNRLDCFIVTSGLLEYAIGTSNINLTAIRTIRVLRPLRAINRVPSMRILVMLLLDTLPMLGSTFLLAFFVFFSFGIVGVQLWAGVLRNRCTLSATSNVSFPRGIPKYYEPQHTYLEYVCSLPKDDGLHSCANLPPYVENGKPCNGSLSDLIWINNTATIPASTCINWHQYYTVCRASEKNPFLGAISFDNIGSAWVAIFLVISLEGWSEIMYLTQDAHSFWVFVYFVILIVIGSFFMINLCLVVIATQFSETKKRETDRMIAERARYHSTSSLGSGIPEPASCYSEFVRFIGHLWRSAKRRAKKLYAEIQEHRIKEQLLKRTARGYYGKKGFHRPAHEVNKTDMSAEGSLALESFDYSKRMLDVQRAEGEPTRLDKSSGHSSSIVVTEGCLMQGTEKPRNAVVDVEGSPDFNELAAGRSHHHSESSSAGANNANPSIKSSSYKESCSSERNTGVTGRRALFNRNCDIEDTSCFWLQEVSPPKERHILSKAFTRTRKCVQKFVNTKVFQRGILLAILINTLTMGAEHHLQPDELTTALEYFNFFFSALFCIEMLFKMGADGFFGYLSNGYNCFDFVIVILSLIEIFQAGGSGLSVLRTFRLLRILKLVRFMPALRRQLVIMIKTMDNVATFFALLILFIFIFSVLGRHLFANKFCSLPSGEDCTCADFKVPNATLVRDRRNFDTMLTSTLTVFQILTQEDWNYVLYLAMRYTSHWAAIYFIALMTFGNYVLFNLLVAILVEGFSDDEVNVSSNDSRGSDGSRSDNHKGVTEQQSTDPAQEQVTEQSTAHPGSPGHPARRTAGNGPLELPTIMRTAATPISMSNLDQLILSTHNKLLALPKRFSRSSRSTSASSVENRAPKTDVDGTEERDGDENDAEIISRRESDLEEFRAHPFRFSQRRRKAKPKAPRSDPFQRKVRSHSLATPFDSTVYLANATRSSGHGLNHQRALSTSANSNGSSLTNGTVTNGIASRKSCLKQPMRSLSMSRVPRHRTASSQRHRPVPPHSNPAVPNPVFPQSLRFDSTCSVYPLSRHDSMDPEGRIATGTEPSEASPARVKKTKRRSSTPGCDTEIKVWWIPRRCKALRKRLDYSYFIFPPTSRFRLYCARFSDHKYFDHAILLCIGLNCITLAMERPSIPPRSTEREILVLANYVFTVIFAVEMALKTIAHGLFIGTRPYTQSGWNVMDGIIVAVSLVDAFLALVAPSNSPKIFGVLRVFRLLRSLRPLRVINRAPGLKLVVETLLTSLRPIGNIVLISAIFFLIFGILGVQLFKGTFWHCQGPPSMIKHVKNRNDCLALTARGVAGVSWVNRKYNFDNVGQALMALFVLSSKDGWVNIMYNGLDAVGVDLQPIENWNEWRLLFFISFLLLVGFFVLNMFVGVVVENFHRCREEQEAEERARRAVKRAERLERRRQKLKEPPYYANYSKIRLYQHNVVTSKYFDLAIALVIGVNVLTMAMEHYLMPHELLYALKIFNYFFTAVFFFEAFFKLVALGIRRYISDRWNQLDVAIVVLSIVGIILEEMENDLIPINPTIIRVMRVLRIARILKLLKMARGIRALLDTVFQALPQVTNLGTLFFLLFFIFSTLGVEMFGRLECDDQHPCEGLGEHAHFRNFGMAFLTLFRVATGDNWNGIMKDALRSDCRSDDECITNCCVSPIIAPIYFVIFVLLAQFTLVNVVVAVLMRHLQESNQIMRDDVLMDDEIEREIHLEHLRQLERHDAEKAMNNRHPEATEVNQVLQSRESEMFPTPSTIASVSATTAIAIPPTHQKSTAEQGHLTAPIGESLALSLPDLHNRHPQQRKDTL